MAKLELRGGWALPSQQGQSRAWAQVCTPGSRIPEGLEVEPASSAGGSLRARTAFRVFVGQGIGGFPHHFLEPQFLCFLSEGLFGTQGLFEALMRGWDTDPSPAPGLWGVPDLANVVPANLRAPVPGVCVYQPWLVSGALWVLGHFVALGLWIHSLASLGLSFFILHTGVATCLLCIKRVDLAHSWCWVERGTPAPHLTALHTGSLFYALMVPHSSFQPMNIYGALPGCRVGPWVYRVNG